MKLFLLSVVIFQGVLLATGEEKDLFLANLKHQFSDVPKDVKLFDFLQNENNLKGLLGLHNDMCQQLTYYNDLQLKAQKRARRDVVDETSAAPSVPDDAANATTADASLGESFFSVNLEAGCVICVIPVILKSRLNGI